MSPALAPEPQLPPARPASGESAAPAMVGRARSLRRLLVPVLATLLIVGSLFAYRYEFRDRWFPKNFGIVEAGHVYRSAALTPDATRSVFTERKIKTVIDLGGFVAGSDKEREAQQLADQFGVTRYSFPLRGDGTGNPNCYVAALKVLADPANHPVLIHCSAGAQRSSVCTMLYRKVFQDQPFDATYAESFNYGHSPRKNPKLRPYLAEWGEQIEAAFRSGTQIDSQPAVDVKPVTKGTLRPAGAIPDAPVDDDQ